MNIKQYRAMLEEWSRTKSIELATQIVKQLTEDFGICSK